MRACTGRGLRVCAPLRGQRGVAARAHRLAFVTSDYIIRGIDCGHAGRRGDSTIFGESAVHAAIRADRVGWLGPNGVIAADCAFSKHDICLTPFRDDSLFSCNYFNFCLRHARPHCPGASPHLLRHPAAG